MLKHWKIRISYKQWHSNFPRRRRKPKYIRKTESYVFSGFGNGISRRWEWKSTTGRFAPTQFWVCTRKILPVGKEKVDNWEFEHWKLRPLLFSLWFKAFFILSPSANTVFIRELSILLLSFVNKVEFSYH